MPYELLIGNDASTYALCIQTACCDRIRVLFAQLAYCMPRNGSQLEVFLLAFFPLLVAVWQNESAYNRTVPVRAFHVVGRGLVLTVH